MINLKTLANIQDSGNRDGAPEAGKRSRVLQKEMGFRTAKKAEYAFLASCAQPSSVPQGMKAFAKLLNYFNVDYTLLPKEYCCGVHLTIEALKEKDEEALKQSQLLQPEFLKKNLSQLQEIGASKVMTFCSGCDMTYHHLKALVPQEILWYPTVLARFFRGGQLKLQADYYTGCYYLSKRLSFPLVDLDSPLRILKQIKGLEVRELDHHLCCSRPKQLEPLVESMQHKTVITICSKCTTNLQEALGKKGSYRVIMLPELAWAAVSGELL